MQDIYITNCADGYRLNCKNFVEYKNEINYFIEYFMKGYNDNEYNSNTYGLSNILKKSSYKHKVKDIQSSVDKYRKGLYGIVTVYSYEKSDMSEVSSIFDELKIYLFDCWGESFEQTKINLPYHDIYIHFHRCEDSQDWYQCPFTIF